MKRSLLLALSLVLFFNSASAQWQLLGGPYGENTAVPVFLDSIYYAGSYQGLLNSTDNGETWDTSTFSFYERTRSTIYHNEGKLIYQRFLHTNGWISLDSGATWAAMDTLSPMRPL